MNTSAIVQKLWNYCNVLRDDGMSYGDYVEQLTYLLFLKMADERTKAPYNQKSPVPEQYNWPSLIKKDGDELFYHYRHTLGALGNRKGLLGLIFSKSQNKFQDSAKLRRLIVDLIDKEIWVSMSADVKRIAKGTRLKLSALLRRMPGIPRIRLAADRCTAFSGSIIATPAFSSKTTDRPSGGVPDNRRYRRTGALWDVRYPFSLEQQETDLPVSQWHIEPDSVKAGLLDDPGNYPRRSDRRQGLGKAQALVTPIRVTRRLDRIMPAGGRLSGGSSAISPAPEPSPRSVRPFSKITRRVTRTYRTRSRAGRDSAGSGTRRQAEEHGGPE